MKKMLIACLMIALNVNMYGWVDVKIGFHIVPPKNVDGSLSISETETIINEIISEITQNVPNRKCNGSEIDLVIQAEVVWNETENVPSSGAIPPNRFDFSYYQDLSVLCQEKGIKWSPLLGVGGIPPRYENAYAGDKITDANGNDLSNATSLHFSPSSNIWGNEFKFWIEKFIESQQPYLESEIEEIFIGNEMTYYNNSTAPILTSYDSASENDYFNEFGTLMPNSLNSVQYKEYRASKLSELILGITNYAKIKLGSLGAQGVLVSSKFAIYDFLNDVDGHAGYTFQSTSMFNNLDFVGADMYVSNGWKVNTGVEDIRQSGISKPIFISELNTFVDEQPSMGFTNEEYVQKIYNYINSGDIAYITFFSWNTSVEGYSINDNSLLKLRVKELYNQIVPFPEQTTLSTLEDWYHPYLTKFTEKRLLGDCISYTSDDLDLTAYVTRAEAVRVMALTLKDNGGIADFDYGSEPPFSDVSSSHADYNYIMKMKQLGYISGDGGAGVTFRPDENIKRAEMAKILSLPFSINSEPLPCGSANTIGSFPDVGESDWFCQYVYPLKKTDISCDEGKPENIIDGYPDGLYKPVDPVNFAELSKFIINCYRYSDPIFATDFCSQTVNLNIQKLQKVNSSWIEIGSQFELTPSPYGQAPSLYFYDSYEIAEGEILILDHGTATNNYGNLYFYWASTGSITSLTPNHRKINFSAPVGDYTVYTWVGSDNGKITEKYINITVCPSTDTNCSGTTTTDDIQFSQAQLSYDEVHIQGYAQDRFLTVSNSSNQAVTIHADILSGSSDYAILNGIGDTNFNLAVGASEEFEVRFNPTVVGSRTGQFRIRWGSSLGNAQIIPLEGTGVSDPPLQIDAPWNLYPSDPKEAGFIINFSADDLAVKHTIEYATNSSFSGSYIEEFIATQSNPYWRIIPPSFGTWYIRVKSENLALGAVSDWSNTISYYWYVDSKPIVFAEDCMPAHESTLAFYNAVDLQFEATGGNDPITYNIYLANSGYPKDSPPIASGIMGNNYTVSGLLPNQSYHWIVEAIDDEGDRDDSPTFKFYTPPNTGTMSCSAQLNGGAATTNTFSVDVQLTNSFPQEELAYYRLSNDGVDWDWWQHYSPYVSGWNLTSHGGTASYGLKTVYVEVKDLSDNVCSSQANITLEKGGGVLFYCNNKAFTSLRAARDESVASSDLYIYAGPGIIDLSKEMGDDPYNFNSNDTGIALPNGTSLIGAGAEKTILLWTSSGYSGIALNDNTSIQGMTLDYSLNRRTLYVGGDNVTITDCHIRGGGYPIEIEYQDGPYNNLTVQRCVIDGNSRDFQIRDLTSAQIVNNVFANSGSFALSDYTGLSAIKIRNNIFYNNNGGYTRNSGGQEIFTNNTMYGVYLNDFPNGMNSNNTVNPSFINANTGNWKLNSSSPCRNTGVNVGLPYNENYPDRGAYEYGATGNLTVNGMLGASCQVIAPDGTVISGAYPFQLTGQAIGMYEIIPSSVDGYYSPAPYNVYVSANGTTTTNVNFVADTEGPTSVQLRINGGQYFTPSTSVSLHIGGMDEVYGIGENSQMQFSLDDTTYTSPEPFSNKVLDFSLDNSNTPSAGMKTVWVKISDNNGNWSGAVSTSIEYKPEMKFVCFPAGDTLVSSDFNQLQPGTVVLLEAGSYLLGEGIYLPSGVSIIGDESLFIMERNIYLGSRCFISGVQFQMVFGSLSFADYVGTGGSYVHTTMSNCIFDNTEEFSLLLDTLVVLNSVFKNFNEARAREYILSSESKIVVENCVFDGGGVDIAEIFNQKAISIENYNGTRATPKIERNIIINFLDDNYSSGGIVINNSEYIPGYPIIQDNGFHNCLENVLDDEGLTQSRGEYNIDPLLQADYHLGVGSPMSGVIHNNPIALNHDGSAGDLGIDGGLSKNTLPCLEATVAPSEGPINQIYTFTLTGSDIETPNSQLRYALDFDGDGILDTAPSNYTTITHQFDTITTAIHCYVFDEHGTVARVGLPSPIESNVTLNMNVFLEGAYNSGGMMSDNLRGLTGFPTTEPYTDLGFTHVFRGGGETIDTTLLVSTPIVDWIFIELRDKASPSTVLATKSALLLTNGQVVDINGDSSLTFDEVVADDYFVAVRHRYHLGLMTATVQSLSRDPILLDFTAGGSLYGGTAGDIQKDLSGGFFGMYGGDLDFSGIIDAADRSAAWNNRNQSGYSTLDSTMDGFCDAEERSQAWNNRNITSAIP